MCDKRKCESVLYESVVDVGMCGSLVLDCCVLSWCVWYAYEDVLSALPCVCVRIWIVGLVCFSCMCVCYVWSVICEVVLCLKFFYETVLYVWCYGLWGYGLY